MYNVKLGKAPVRHDGRTLKLTKYLADFELPVPPASLNWTSKLVGEGWGMMANDKYGDCTCAGAGHMAMSWEADNGKIITLADTDILAAYAAITGFDLATGNNDNGANELDVLNYWRKTGIAGHKIGGFAALELQKRSQVELAVYLFGGVYIGVSLPLYAQGKSQWDIPQSLDGPGAPGSWGGHAVPIIDYDENYCTVITWGAPMKMSWDFYNAYCEEAYAVFSMDFISGAKSPDGFDLSALQADLNTINQAA